MIPGPILTKKKDVELVGCSAMLMYDYGFDTLFRLKSFGPNHTVNCCMAYRKEYFNKHKYDDDVCVLFDASIKYLMMTYGFQEA